MIKKTYITVKIIIKFKSTLSYIILYNIANDIMYAYNKLRTRYISYNDNNSTSFCIGN